MAMADSIITDVQWVTVANSALLWIGADTINNLDEGSPGALFCSQMLPLAIKTVYSSYPWKQALKRVQLPPMVNNPHYGYAHQFALPSDFALIHEVKTEGEYSIERHRILSNSTSVFITYVALPSQPREMSPMLETLVTRQLAYLISTPMLKNSEVTNRLSNEYMQNYALAITQDSLGSYQEPIELEDTWYDQNR